MSQQKYATAPVATSGMPRGIPYIIGNEAAERFSFYGMAVLSRVAVHDEVSALHDSTPKSG
ncbi:MAG: hypothetical protein R3C19_11670 [Planctomycetaceae bacterium]